MHSGKRDKLICSINFVNIDRSEKFYASHMSGTQGLSIRQHDTASSLKALILRVEEKDVSVQTELEQECHRVLLPHHLSF